MVLQDDDTFTVILWWKARQDFPHKKSLVKPVDHYSKLREINYFCGNFKLCNSHKCPLLKAL